jgi:hypothetical protein
MLEVSEGVPRATPEAIGDLQLTGALKACAIARVGFGDQFCSRASSEQRLNKDEVRRLVYRRCTLLTLC